jgi:hypothetical protein
MIAVPRSTRDITAAVIGARWDGETILEISAQFGLSPDNVITVLRRCRFPFSSARSVRALPPTIRERLRSGEAPLCDPLDNAAFRRYLRDRGLLSGTVTVYANNARVCLNAGVSDPDDVDATFPDHASTTRHVYRSALRWYHAYRSSLEAS